jgi:hypothetical protein
MVLSLPPTGNVRVTHSFNNKPSIVGPPAQGAVTLRTPTSLVIESGGGP